MLLAAAAAPASANDLKDGRKALEAGRLDEAQVLFERAAEKGSAEGRASIGLVQLRKRQLGEALESFLAAQKMDPNLALGWYGEGEVYLRQENCAKAIPLLQKATEMDRRFPEAQLALGHCLITSGEHEQAVDALTKGLKWGPDWRPKFLVALGDAEMTRDSLRDAGIYYHRAVEESPDDPVSQRALGDFYTARGTFELAIPYYTTAIEKNPNDVELRYKLGKALFYAQRYNEALTEYRKVVEMDPEFAPGQLALGDLYYRSGAADPKRYREAIAPLERYVQLKPADPAGWSVLGRTRYFTGAKEAALEAMNRADSLGDRSKELYLLRARAHVDRREWDAALADYGRADPETQDQLRIAQVWALKGDEAKAESLYNAIVEAEGTSSYAKFSLGELGKLKFRTQAYEQAVEVFQRLIALDPENDEAYYYIGLCYKEMKQYPQSLDALRRSAGLAPDKADRQFWLGILYAQMDSVPQARRTLGRAAELDPEGKSRNTALALQRLGYYHLLDRQWAEAIRVLERSVQINDSDGQSWVWLGQAYQNSGNVAKACAAYKRALELMPGQPEAVQGKQVLGC